MALRPGLASVGIGVLPFAVLPSGTITKDVGTAVVLRPTRVFVETVGPVDPDPSDLITRNGVRQFSPSAALVKVPESFFGRQPIESQVVLAGLRDGSDLLRFLLSGGNSVKAGVIAGALRRIGRAELADEVLKTMKAAGYDARESDPFDPTQAFGMLLPAVSPIVGRIQAMWSSMRSVVAEHFPDAPGLPED